MNEGLALAIFGLLAWIFKQEYNRRRDKKDIESPDLIHHNLINSYFDSKSAFLKNSWYMSDEGRTIIIRTAMLKKIEILDKYLTQLAKDVDKCIENCDENNLCNKLYAMNMKALNNANNEYRNFYLQHDKFSPQEIEIYDIFMKEFSNYNAKSIINIENYIKRACKNDYVTDCKVIQSMIFDFYQSDINILFMDMNESIIKINGRLTGKVINGVTIGGVNDVYTEVEYNIE